MKKTDLERLLRRNGWLPLRSGSKHDIWVNRDGREEQVPRHKEISERLAKSIVKKWQLS